MIMKTEIENYNACSEAVEFRKQFKTFEEAWNNCPRGDWMLWIASKLKVDKRKLVLTKALCAETVLHLMTDERSINAVNVAKEYGLGNAFEEDVKDAYAAADAAYAAYSDYAAAAAAYAAYSDYAYAAADAAADAAYAAADAAADAKTDNKRKTADICREILTEEVFKLINNDRY